MLYLPLVSGREPAQTDADGEHLDAPEALADAYAAPVGSWSNQIRSPSAIEN